MNPQALDSEAIDLSMSVPHLLVQENCIGSAKLLGVLEALKIDFQLVSKSENSLLLEASDYEQAPIVYYGGDSAELFWGALLFLDFHLLDSRIQISDPEAKAELYKLLERCDYEIFTVLMDGKVNPKKQNNTPDRSLVTSLLQWIFQSPRQKRSRALSIQRKNVGAEEISRERALNHLNEIRGSNSLPSPYREVLEGAISGVLKA